MKHRKIILPLVALVAFFGLAASSCDDGGKSSNKSDEAVSDRIQGRMQDSQPTPEFDFSQQRQNLIEILTAQADTTQTTSFFFLEGVGLVGQCPSIGFPIPSTAQLTNPSAEKGPRESRVVLPQIEPNGIYSGESTGTYTICVDDDGKAYASYFEGYVQTVTGPADFVDGKIKLTGKPTGGFTKGK